MPTRRSVLLMALLAAGCREPDAPPGVMTDDLPQLKPRARFNSSGPAKWDRPVQISADGKVVAISYEVGTDIIPGRIDVLNISGQPKVLAQLDGGRFALSPSGALVCTQSRGVSAVWDVKNRKRPARLPIMLYSAFFVGEDIVVATENPKLELGHQPGKVTVWNVSANADAGSFDIADHRVVEAFPVRDGAEIWLVVGGDKFEIERYDRINRTLTRVVSPEPVAGKAYANPGTWRTVAGDGSIFAAHTGTMNFYAGDSGKILGGLPSDLNGSSTGFLPGGSRYLARPTAGGAQAGGVQTSDLVIFDWKARKPVAILTGHPIGQVIGHAVCSADGKTIVSVTDQGVGLVFDVPELK